MEICSVCGKKSLMPEKYGDAFLCKICSMKILSPTWKSKEYLSNDEVDKQREKVIKLANFNGFPVEVIEDIGKFFEDKKVDGLITVFHGNRGQTLTVCETHCIIDTTGSFDYKKAEKAYLKLMTSEKRGGNSSLGMLDSVINNQTASGILVDVVGGVLTGGILKKQIIKAGKNIAVNAITKQLTGDNQRGAERKPIVLSIQSGERLVKYSDYDIVKYIEPVGEEEYGFIKFQNSKYVNDSEEDVLFFFGSGSYIKKEASQLYGFIKKRVNDINEVLETSISVNEVSVTAQKEPTSSTADEILKFKQLLDMGAISQEEYDVKKKQLLGL
jgi:hypothetical protein